MSVTAFLVQAAFLPRQCCSRSVSQRCPVLISTIPEAGMIPTASGHLYKQHQQAPSPFRHKYKTFSSYSAYTMMHTCIKLQNQNDLAPLSICYLSSGRYMSRACGFASSFQFHRISCTSDKSKQRVSPKWLIKFSQPDKLRQSSNLKM